MGEESFKDSYFGLGIFICEYIRFLLDNIAKVEDGIVLKVMSDWTKNVSQIEIHYREGKTEEVLNIIVEVLKNMPSYSDRLDEFRAEIVKGLENKMLEAAFVEAKILNSYKNYYTSFDLGIDKLLEICRNFRQQELESYIRDNIAPQNCVIGLLAKIDDDELKKSFELFSTWQSGWGNRWYKRFREKYDATRIVDETMKGKKRDKFFILREKEPMHIYLWFEAPGYEKSEFYDGRIYWSLLVANEILNGDAKNSSRRREIIGVVNYPVSVECGIYTMRENSLILTKIETNSENAKSVIADMRALFNLFVAGSFSYDEFVNAKVSLINKIVKVYSDVSFMIRYRINEEIGDDKMFNFIPSLPLSVVTDRIKNLTFDEFLSVVKDYFNTKKLKVLISGKMGGVFQENDLKDFMIFTVEGLK